MKRIMFLLLIMLTSHAYGATFYVNSLNGLDSNTGLSPSMAWKSLSRVNTTVFAPGDTILLKRGCTWKEELSASASGSTNHPIVYSAYGLSGDAVISGNEGQALTVIGRSNLKFERLCLRDHLVYLRDASKVTFACCIIRNSLDRGVQIENSTDISIFNCDVTLTRYEGILARGSNTTVTIRNSLIFGNGEGVSFSGFYASEGATITYDHNLVSGNGYTPAFNIYGSGLVDEGGNLTKANPKITRFAKNDGYFVICTDDYNVNYWKKLNATLKPLGVRFTMFVNGALIPEGKIADLRTIAKDGNEIASHGWSHSKLIADTLCTISTTNQEPWVTINPSTRSITLACQDTSKNVSLSWATEPKTILDLQNAVMDKGWTITIPPEMSNRVILSSMADSRGPQVAFPYVVKPDVSAPDYPFWRDELIQSRNWTREQFGDSLVTLSYPYGIMNDGLKSYTRDMAGFIGARTILPTGGTLSQTDIFHLPGFSFSAFKGNGSETAVRANARCAAVHAAQIGSIFVIYAHHEAEMSLKQVGWFVNEVRKNGGKFYTMQEAVEKIRSDHVSENGYVYTKNYADNTNFHLLTGSPCINAGTEVPIVYDYEGKPMNAGGGYDIGAFESSGVPPTFTITASAGANGSITPSGAVKVPWGGDQGFTITPADKYLIASVIVDNVSVGPISSYTFGNVSANHTIQATFVEEKEPLETEEYGPWAASPYNSSEDHTFRIPIKPEVFTINGDRVRINVAASSSDSLTIVQAFIGEKAISGDPYDMQPGTITQITFQKGKTSVSIPAGNELLSDWMYFPYDRKKEYIVSLGVTGGFLAWPGSANGSWYYWTSQNSGLPDLNKLIPSAGVYVMDRLELGVVVPDTATVTEVYGNWTSGDQNGKGNQNFRIPVPPGSFTIEANSVRINLEASATQAMKVTGAYIGEAASSGDAFDMEPDTIIPITFNGGNSTCTISAGATKYSDWIPVTLDPARTYIVSLGVTGGYHSWIGMGKGAWYLLNGENKAAVPDISALTKTSTVYALERMELSTAEVQQTGKIAVSGADEQEAPETLTSSIECFPNPFNMSTTIQFTLTSENVTRLSIYNISGQKVRTLLESRLSAGKHAVIWNGLDERGRAVSSGMYFARLQSGSTVLSRRMVFMK